MLYVYKLHLPQALLQLCCLWKIYLCLLSPNCIEKLLPEQDSFKMLYGLHAAAWISIAKISFCGLWTISDNECKFQGNFHWLFEALAISSLWIFCSISLHHNMSLCTCILLASQKLLKILSSVDSHGLNGCFSEYTWSL